MNAITRAIADLKFKIPPEILDIVFVKNRQRWRDTPQNLDSNILETVIRPRVLVDCNLVGGTEAYVSLEGIPFERMNDYTSVYRIPKDRTQNRSIMSVLNITFSDPTRTSNYGVASGINNSTLLQAGQAVMDAHASMPVTSTANIDLIGENTIVVRDTVILPPNTYIRCVLANDENLSHIHFRSYRPFSHLVTLAVKAYIYNEYSIKLDAGELHGGQALGKFKEIIEQYADAEELYDAFITEKWQKISTMNDPTTYDRFLKTIVGGYR